MTYIPKLLLVVLILLPSMARADRAPLGECELKKTAELEGWNQLQNDPRFEYAQVCRFAETEKMDSVILYGFLRKQDGVFYRDYYVATSSGDTIKLGLMLPSVTRREAGFDICADNLTIQSKLGTHSILRIYRNAIGGLHNCLGNERCVESFLSSYGLFGRLFDQEYKDFKTELLRSENKQQLVSGSQRFIHDAEMHRLSFTTSLEDRDWYLELSLLPTGEINGLTRVSPSPNER